LFICFVRFSFFGSVVVVSFQNYQPPPKKVKRLKRREDSPPSHTHTRTTIASPLVDVTRLSNISPFLKKEKHLRL
jgi:hypothetical protein